MCQQNNSKYLLLFIIVTVSTWLSACGISSNTQRGVVSRQQAEFELVSFMLDYIVQQKIPGNQPNIPPDERSLEGTYEIVSIIVLAPPGEDPDSSHNTLDLAQPIRVWLYTDNQLYEAIDRTETIEHYRQDHMDYHKSRYWGFYDFGIINISEDGQQAKVFWEVSCGIDCGHGYMHILQRTASGDWEITGTEWMWIA